MPYSEEEPHRPTGTAFLVAVALVIGFAIVYIIGLRGFQDDAIHREAIYNPDRTVPDAYLQVNASIQRIDPLLNTVSLRLILTPKGGLAAADGRAPRQDIHISLPTMFGPREISLRAGQRPQTVLVLTSLDGLDNEGGEINQYPFDRYRSRLDIRVQNGLAPLIGVAPTAGPPATATRLPAILVFDAAMRGMHVDSKLLPESESGNIALELSVRRSRAFVGLALAVDAVMAVMALSALLVAASVALGRRVDFTMMIWTGALLFVFPAMRAALPGAPPTGVLTDVLVYFWAMLLAGLSMAVLVLVWLKREE